LARLRDDSYTYAIPNPNSPFPEPSPRLLAQFDINAHALLFHAQRADLREGVRVNTTEGSTERFVDVTTQGGAINRHAIPRPHASRLLRKDFGFHLQFVQIPHFQQH